MMNFDRFSLVDECGIPTSRRLQAHDYWAEHLNSNQKAWVLRQIPERNDAAVIISLAISYVAEHLLTFEESDGVLSSTPKTACPEYCPPPQKKRTRSLALS